MKRADKIGNPPPLFRREPYLKRKGAVETVNSKYQNVHYHGCLNISESRGKGKERKELRDEWMMKIKKRRGERDDEDQIYLYALLFGQLQSGSLSTYE